MRIYRAKDYYDMSRKAANIISAQVIMKPDCVLGLATGSTPVGTYAQLVEWYKKGDLDFSEVKTVNLDEYKGLDQSNDQSYFYFMAEHLFDKVNIDFQNVNIPNGMETDADKECARYEAKIKALGGGDLLRRRLEREAVCRLPGQDVRRGRPGGDGRVLPRRVPGGGEKAPHPGAY